MGGHNLAVNTILFSNFHDSIVWGYSGRAVLYYWVQSLFGWTDLKIGVEQLVTQCPVFQQTQGEQQFPIGPLHQSSMGGYFFNSLYRYAVLVLAVSMIKGSFQHWVAAWIQQRAADSSVIEEHLSWAQALSDTANITVTSSKVFATFIILDSTQCWTLAWGQASFQGGN